MIVLANGIRTGNPSEFNKGCSSKFHVGFQVQQTPEEGRRTYRSKPCGNNNKDEDNSKKSLKDKNQQALSQKFRQFISCLIEILEIHRNSWNNVYSVQQKEK